MNLLTAKELTKHYTDKELFTGQNIYSIFFKIVKILDND